MNLRAEASFGQNLPPPFQIFLCATCFIFANICAYEVFQYSSPWQDQVFICQFSISLSLSLYRPSLHLSLFLSLSLLPLLPKGIVSFKVLVWRKFHSYLTIEPKQSINSQSIIGQSNTNRQMAHEVPSNSNPINLSYWPCYPFKAPLNAVAKEQPGLCHLEPWEAGWVGGESPRVAWAFLGQRPLWACLLFQYCSQRQNVADFLFMATLGMYVSTSATEDTPQKSLERIGE